MYTEDHDYVAGLQSHVRVDSATQLRDGQADFSDAEVRQAIVHAREDIVLLVGWLERVNAKTKGIRWTNFWLFSLMVLNCYQMFLQ